MTIARRLKRPCFRVAIGAAFGFLLGAPGNAQTPVRAPDRVLHGSITRRDHQHVRVVPFLVPVGTTRLSLAFDFDGRAQKTVIDLGLRDPGGFRGASGGNKAELTIAASDATPSYLPGPIQPGRWQLMLGVPNIREGVSARWTARLWFMKAGEAGPPAPVIDRGPGWYRGDLHLHTGHSDGVCASQSGTKIPCPVIRTLETAVARGLDFVAITDHNTVSQLDEIRAAQPAFDRLLIISGQEVTTFFGHFNVFGVDQPVDFRIGPGARSFADTVARVHALGGLVSINHPALPSGEICMGCGWRMPDAVGPDAVGPGKVGPGAGGVRVDAVEAVNGGAWLAGGTADGPLSGIPFWIKALAAAPVTAIGGSDNHDATQAVDRPGTIGRPTTVVEASGLTQVAIIDGLRRGRAFIDLAGAPGTLLDITVGAGSDLARMGAVLRVVPGASIDVTIDARAPSDNRIELIIDDAVVADAAFSGNGNLKRSLAAVPGRSIVRAVVRRSDGRLLLISNAVVVEPR